MRSDLKLLTGCEVGAAAADELERWLALAGFTAIRIRTEGGEPIRDQGMGAGPARRGLCRLRRKGEQFARYDIVLGAKALGPKDMDEIWQTVPVGTKVEIRP